MPAEDVYVLNAEYLNPDTGPAKGPKVKREDLGEKIVTLTLADSSLAKTRTSAPERTFQFRYDNVRGELWSKERSDGPTEPLTHQVYVSNDYQMIDRTNLLPGSPDRVDFVVTGSGMCIKWGACRAQCPLPNDWKSLVYEVFNLHESFTFDVIFLYMGTNDLKNIISRKVYSTRKIPATLDEFVVAVEHHLADIAKVFGSRCCYLGAGPGELSAYEKPKNPGKFVFEPDRLSFKQATREMCTLLSLLNATVCERAIYCYDEDGFARSETRVVLFGQSAFNRPRGITDPGTGHFLAGSASLLAVMLHNIREIVLVKLELLPRPPARPLCLIKRVTDAKRYADTDGNIQPYKYCETWEAQELAGIMPGILKKCATNDTPLTLAPETRFDVPYNLTAKIECEPGKFMLGQVAAIKLKPKYETYDPEHHGIVITSEDPYRCLIFNLDKQVVQLVAHRQIVVPYFMAPADRDAAIGIMEDLLGDVQMRLEQGRAIASAREPYPPLPAPENPANGVAGIRAQPLGDESPISPLSGHSSDSDNA
jgi:hypothetical protein